MLLHLLIYVLLGVLLSVPLFYLLRRLGILVSPARYLRPYLPPSQRSHATQEGDA